MDSHDRGRREKEERTSSENSKNLSSMPVVAIIITESATLAQSVEQRTRNASVAGSNPAGGSKIPAARAGIFSSQADFFDAP